ncbi:MAG: NADH-quinone oxidoreductase subunit C [Chitinophagales bacterium]|nr:NADH-quinone oxidoreductase subunit C [Chitinophagales bacterium]
MTNEELKTKISEILPTATFDETGEWLNIWIDANDWLPLAWQLRANAELDFEFLFSITGVDWKTHFTVVYHLRSIKHGHIVVVKAKCERANPEIQSVCKIWKTAELTEREVYDLLGIKFLNHPDLRRLFLTEDWEGYPLRKDYVDEVNMIKL